MIISLLEKYILSHILCLSYSDVNHLGLPLVLVFTSVIPGNRLEIYARRKLDQDVSIVKHI